MITVKKTKLYNVIFPIWLLWLFPITWLISLPANFVIDLLVVVLAMRHLKVENVKANAKKVILKVWIMGFLSDIVGSLGLLLANLLDQNTEWWNENIIIPINYSPFSSIWGFLWITACVILTGVIIYFINKCWCLKKADLTEIQRKKVALALAVFTAPYLFYLPTEWFV